MFYAIERRDIVCLCAISATQGCNIEPGDIQTWDIGRLFKLGKLFQDAILLVLENDIDDMGVLLDARVDSLDGILKRSVAHQGHDRSCTSRFLFTKRKPHGGRQIPAESTRGEGIERVGRADAKHVLHERHDRRAFLDQDDLRGR